MSYSGFIILATLDQRVSIYGPFEDQQLAREEAESATAQGRARQAFVLPILDTFNEASRAWANPDQGGFVHAYPSDGTVTDVATGLNPGQGEQPIPKAEAEAQAPTPTESIQANVLQGQQDGNPDTTGEADQGGQNSADANAQAQAEQAQATQTPPAEPQPSVEPNEHPPTARPGTRASQLAKPAALKL